MIDLCSQVFFKILLKNWPPPPSFLLFDCLLLFQSGKMHRLWRMKSQQIAVKIAKFLALLKSWRMAKTAKSKIFKLIFTNFYLRKYGKVK